MSFGIVSSLLYLSYMPAFLFSLQKSSWFLKAELNSTCSCNICNSGPALSLTCVMLLLSNLRMGAFVGIIHLCS